MTDLRVLQSCWRSGLLAPSYGSGTTASVAEQCGRRWISIDTSRVPLALARQRLLTATFPYYEIRRPGPLAPSLSPTGGEGSPATAGSGERETLYQVELLGLDVFDPVTMETTRKRGEDVPVWFLDTDYNELAFCVGQAFFPRTAAWDSLKRELGGVYADSVWEHLAGTVSEPFAAGAHRQIAVKVFDDRGNELLVVRKLEEAEEAK